MIYVMIPLLLQLGSESRFKQKRHKMVRSQIIERAIEDTLVINAMLKVKRHLFVPRKYRELSYEDHPLPIAFNQTISQPYIVALMTELLNLKKDDRVLEIGTGSGYQAAILSLIVDSVYTIEIIPGLADSARLRLKELGYENVKVKTGDGFLGWPEHAPFNKIIVTCAPDEVPPPLIEQLAAGGRMVIPVGSYFQELKVIRKDSNGITEKSIIPVRFVPMTGEH